MDKIIKRFSEIKSENKDLVVKLMSKAAKNEQTIYGEVSDWIRDYHSDLSLLEREVLAKMLLGDLVIHHSDLLQPKSHAKADEVSNEVVEKISWYLQTRHNMFHADMIQRAMFDENISLADFITGTTEIVVSERDTDNDEFTPTQFQNDWK